MSRRPYLDRHIADMPDLVKLTIVGLAVDPPTVDSRTAEPMFVMTLDHLVEIGIAVASVNGPMRTYRLTMFGVEIYDAVKVMRQRDATLPANDLDYDAPGAA